MGTKAIVMVFDDKFIIPACTTITSLLVNKRSPDVHYVIHVCTPGLSNENIAILKQFESEKWATEIVIHNSSIEKYRSIYTQYDGNTGAGSITALIKFDIPYLVEDDIALYLDSDLIVRKDISEIFDCSMGNEYAAAVRDSGIIYNKDGLRGSLSYYFNSGVMLLNLSKMRDTNATKMLVDARASLNNIKLVDQDAFNIVFDKHVVPLPIKYNCLIVNLYNSSGKFDIRSLNLQYATDYSCIYDVHDDASIIHFASKEKPWKYSDAPYSKEWFDYYSISPCKGCLVRSTLKSCNPVDNIPFILATDSNYTPQTGITILSALENRTCSSKYSFYILTSSIFSKDIDDRFQEIVKKYGNCSVEYVKLDENLFNDVKINIPHITHPTFYRLIGASLFPQYEKIIYLDSDVVVEGDLLDYYSTELGDNYVAGVNAPSYHWPNDGNLQYCKNNGLPAIDQYVNAGVLIFNLKMIREYSIEKEFIRLSKLGLRSQDQDVINRACYDHIHHMPYKFNCMIAKYEKTPEQLHKIFTDAEINEANNCPIITHYAAEVKPWADLTCPLSDRWWKYAKMSPFYDVVLDGFHEKQIINGKKVRLHGYGACVSKEKTFVFIGETPENKTIRDWFKDLFHRVVNRLGADDKMSNSDDLIERCDMVYKTASDVELSELYGQLMSLTSTHNPQIYARLARMYRDGKGVKKNLSEAMRLYEIASTTGIRWAKREYVDVLISGGKYYDYEKAFRISSELADEGDAFGACRLARLYKSGKGTKADVEKALFWYSKALSSTPLWASEYVDLLIATKNQSYISQAVNIAETLAIDGDPAIQKRLAHIYDAGIGVERNCDLAAKWILEAYKVNRGYAKDCLSILNATGDDTYLEKAFEICRELAEGGDAEMQGKLARMYRDGRGVLKNIDLAIDWYKKAASNGNAWASVEMNELVARG